MHWIQRALAAIVGADARPQALLAGVLAVVMLAYMRSTALLAPALDALVGAVLDPRHFLHWLLMRMYMFAYLHYPSHCLQWLSWRWWGQRR